MNVADEILSRGENSKVAVVYRESSLTYLELRQMVDKVVSGLLALGYRKGDRMGIFSESSPFWVAAYLGIIRAGMVAVPLQPELRLDNLGKIVRKTGLAAIFVSKRLEGRMRQLAENAEVVLLEEHLEFQIPIRRPVGGSPPPHPDLAALMFTSGSTGDAKGVMITHQNIQCNTRDIIAYMDLGPEDRAMVVLPLHYCFGTSLLQTHLMAGGSVVLNNDFRLYPEVMLNEMRQTECTGLAGVPSTYQILLRKSRFRQMSFPKLRWFQQAGGKLPNSYITELLTSFPGVRYFLMYGQTEATARLSFLPPERLADKLGSVGCGLPSTRLEVLKPDGTAVAAGSGETGEIVASGANISPGYWQDPAETSRFFKNGRLHTGDVARVDSDGFIFVVDRERDMIKCGGNRVSAKEVEDVITEIPEIVEAAVVGAGHEILGESINAFVVVRPGAETTVQTVINHCRTRLPSFEIPQAVIFIENMPHSGSGKVLKTELKRMLEEQALIKLEAPLAFAKAHEARGMR